ncbi:hypothetical protein BDR22DRAFT_818742 [Usnea florida]
MQAPVAGTSPDRTTADLESQIGDLTIPKPVAKNITTAEINSRSAPTYDTLLGDIGDFRLPSDITAGHVAKMAKSRAEHTFVHAVAAAQDSGQGNCALPCQRAFQSWIDIIIGWLFDNGSITQDNERNMPVQQLTVAMASRDARFVVRIRESVREELRRI